MSFHGQHLMAAFGVFGKVGGESGWVCEVASVPSVCAVESRRRLAPMTLCLERGRGAYRQHCAVPRDSLDSGQQRGDFSSCGSSSHLPLLPLFMVGSLQVTCSLCFRGEHFSCRWPSRRRTAVPYVVTEVSGVSFTS